MKAEKTRKLLYEMVMISDVQPPRELVSGAEAELTRLEELAAKGLRAEQAEREIDAEMYKGTVITHSDVMYFSGLRFAMDRLKGVE